MRYDYLIVGTGLFGAVFAHEMKKAGIKCLCIDKRKTLGGNVYTEEWQGIQVHKYGAHIFHTSDKKIWDYVNQFAEFNNYVNSPLAVYGQELYNLPFNMNTFSKMWGIKTPKEAKAIIESQRAQYHFEEPANLEEQALSLVGRDVYEKLVKGYTEKQWGRDCKELPAFIIKRLPVRFTYDNNYFNDRYQGIPIGGYTSIVEKLLEGIPVKLGVSYKEFIAGAGCRVPGRHAVNCSGELEADDRGDTFDKVLYTGMIDEYFDYALGELGYRGLRFEHERVEAANLQGVAVMNFTDRETPYTRSIEHKHFEPQNASLAKKPVTVVTKEYPADWHRGDEAYYPVNDEKNQALYEKYAARAASERVIFGGRLGEYKYYDMDKTVERALALARSLTA